MERKQASDFDQDLLNLFDQYVHGLVDRRGFLERAARFAVGGLTDFAAGNDARLLRTSEGDKQYSVRLKDLIKRADISANVEMKPGDILIIPQSFF